MSSFYDELDRDRPRGFPCEHAPAAEICSFVGARCEKLEDGKGLEEDFDGAAD